MFAPLRSMLQWLRGPDQPSLCPHPTVGLRLDLDGIQRGIDNLRIDVQLSPRFVRHAVGLSVSLLGQHAAPVREHEPPGGAVRGELEAFRAAYASVLESTVHRARSVGQPALVGLFQLAVIKLVLESVERELQRFIYDLKVALTANRAERAMRAVELYDRLVWITANSGRIRFSITRLLLQQLYKVEAGPLGELQGALLGVARAVPLALYLNPLLQSNGGDEELLLRHYVLLGHRTEDRNSPAALLDLLRRACLDLSADGCRPDPLHHEPELLAEDVLAHERRGESGALIWADTPENIDVLLNWQPYGELLRTLKRERRRPELWPLLKVHRRFQRRQWRLLQRLVREADLARDIVASYELRELVPDFGRRGNPQLLYQCLVGGRRARQALPKLKAILREPEQAALLRRLDLAASRVRRHARGVHHEHVVRYLRDFAAYRRDLRQLRELQAAMQQLHFLTDQHALRLSEANNTLHRFAGPDEDSGRGQRIRAHAVIKADVRGSTQITAGLLQRGLNPASHFDAHFFSPIRSLLDRFGASKVFIEGDAVILSIVELEREPNDWLCVARACGLAHSMLELVGLHNRANRAHGLPLLELGIGISYCPDPPAFLYDGDQPIMISPAIALADRLSSCNAALRRRFPGTGTPRHPVAVFQLATEHTADPALAAKGAELVRYNVNGIALDTAAFDKLRTETQLRRLEVEIPGSGEATVFYLGRYPDATGVLRKLAVREGLVRWMHEPKSDAGSPYYEVVSVPKLRSASTGGT